MRVWSRITLNVTNEHTGSLKSEIFTIRPGVFVEVPEWAQKHPVFQAATTPYTDGSGIEREADVIVLDDDKQYLFPSSVAQPAFAVSGTNVSENPQAGKPLKGAYRKGADAAAQPVPAAIVDEGLTEGAK